MDNPKVKAYFQTLDVDVHEGGMLDIVGRCDGDMSLRDHLTVFRYVGSFAALLLQYCLCSGDDVSLVIIVVVL